MDIKSHRLKNKRILITAGPTWVPIDKVRFISNFATGETGLLLARKFKKAGARVTLLRGPFEFRVFANRLREEVASKRFDIVIHAAAVSDYKSSKNFTGKIKSGIKKWRLELVPTEKLIDGIKKTDPGLFLVGFKFEPVCSKEKLVKEANELMRRAKLDLAVANTVISGRYKAFILGRGFVKGPLRTKRSMAGELVKMVRKNI